MFHRLIIVPFRRLMGWPVHFRIPADPGKLGVTNV